MDPDASSYYGIFRSFLKIFKLQNSHTHTNRLLFVFVLPLIDFLTDVVLVSTILTPALETTELCVSTSPKTYRGGHWYVNKEDCGLLDSQAVETGEELGGCPVDQRKPPRDGMCYDPVLHNLAFIEGDTSTRCTFLSEFTLTSNQFKSIQIRQHTHTHTHAHTHTHTLT